MQPRLSPLTPHITTYPHMSPLTPTCHHLPYAPLRPLASGTTKAQRCFRALPLCCHSFLNNKSSALLWGSTPLRPLASSLTKARCNFPCQIYKILWVMHCSYEQQSFLQPLLRALWKNLSLKRS